MCRIWHTKSAAYEAKRNKRYSQHTCWCCHCVGALSASNLFLSFCFLLFIFDFYLFKSTIFTTKQIGTENNNTEVCYLKVVFWTVGFLFDHLISLLPFFALSSHRASVFIGFLSLFVHSSRKSPYPPPFSFTSPQLFTHRFFIIFGLWYAWCLSSYPLSPSLYIFDIFVCLVYSFKSLTTTPLTAFLLLYAWCLPSLTLL